MNPLLSLLTIYAYLKNCLTLETLVGKNITRKEDRYCVWVCRDDGAGATFGMVWQPFLDLSTRLTQVAITKDGHLFGGDMCEVVSCRDSVVVFRVDNVTEQHAGNYQLHLQNQLGAAILEFTIKVSGGLIAQPVTIKHLFLASILLN